MWKPALKDLCSCTRPLVYIFTNLSILTHMFMLKLSLQLTMSTEQYSYLLVYIPLDLRILLFLPVLHAQLTLNSSACLHTHTPTYLKINLPVHLDAFLQLTMKTYPSAQLFICISTCLQTHSTYLFILKFSFQPTSNIYLSIHRHTHPPPWCIILPVPG